jgi:hypothetical protein
MVYLASYVVISYSDVHVQLNLNSVWLHQPGGGRQVAFFPDVRNERFDFCSDVGFLITRLQVEGSSFSESSPSTSGNNPSTSGSSTSRVFSTLGSATSSIIPVGKKNSNPTLKIFKGTIVKKSNGHLAVERIGQTFVTITDSTANVPYLTHHVKEKWGQNYVLVSNDAIRIEDSSGTQGGLIRMCIHVAVVA